MICKKCGAYNPDHATFCKVCAANLKDQSEAEGDVQVEEAEEAVEEKVRPRRGNVKLPDFATVLREGGFKAASKAEKPAEQDDDDAEEPVEEEEVKPAARQSRFSRPAAPVNKRRVIDADDDEDEEEEDEYDDVKDEGDAEKLESEPQTTRFSRSAAKKRPIYEDEDEDEEEEYDDEDEEEEYDDEDEEDEEEYDDDDDEYEEYEPTPPRRKKSAHSRGKNSGGPNIVTLLIVCLLAILLIIVGIVAFCNIKGGATKSKLPSFLQFNCSGKASTEATVEPQQQPVAPSSEPQSTEPTDAPVTGTQVDYSAAKVEEFVDSEGRECLSVNMTSRPGDTITILLPNQDDWVVPNDSNEDQAYQITIFKSCYYPNRPLEKSESVYTVTPEIMVTHADGTQEPIHLGSFELTFPTIQLELIEPDLASIPEEGIMAAEGNELIIKGKVDDHSVTVTVNGQRVPVYNTDGTFDYTFSLTGEEAETVTIEASKVDYVSSSCSFTVTPYVFIPEAMKLEVVSDVAKLKADKNNKVIVTGTTVPGTTLTATPAAEYQSSVACGAPVVDAEGSFSFDVTFYEKYYGIANITIHAKKDGYEEGEATCTVTRMVADRSQFTKNKNFHQVPSSYEFSKVMENPTDSGFYRFEGSVVSIDQESGVITFAARSNGKNLKETTNIYIVNASTWRPKVGGKAKLYCTLNGLYTDGESLFATAWFYV